MLVMIKKIRIKVVINIYTLVSKISILLMNIFVKYKARQ